MWVENEESRLSHIIFIHLKCLGSKLTIVPNSIEFLISKIFELRLASRMLRKSGLVRRIYDKNLNRNCVDFFEIDQALEEPPRLLASCATTWFKVTGNKSPSTDEYRNKVISIVQLFENTLVSGFPDIEEIEPDVKIHIRNKLKVQSSNIISGANKEVEKRYKYYVSHWVESGFA
jgi:hypothetical protein